MHAAINVRIAKTSRRSGANPEATFIPFENFVSSVAIDQVIAFERWLRENGGTFPRLEIRQYDKEVRGVHAREDVDPDEVIVEIPLK